MRELLPCPFCGGRAELRDQVGRFSVLKIVVCGECLAQSYPSYEPGDTVAAWNKRRAAPAALNVDRLVEALCQLVATASPETIEDEELRAAYLSGNNADTQRRTHRFRALVLAALQLAEPPLADPIAHAQIMNPD